MALGKLTSLQIDQYFLLHLSLVGKHGMTMWDETDEICGEFGFICKDSCSYYQRSRQKILCHRLAISVWEIIMQEQVTSGIGLLSLGCVFFIFEFTLL